MGGKVLHYSTFYQLKNPQNFRLFVDTVIIKRLQFLTFFAIIYLYFRAAGKVFNNSTVSNNTNTK